ncbi:MAG: hypothetical protein E7632_02095 [Ruminococcaceae bacterium]|nr:hypothetical protein [Oscillospiraceae bacterium]
MREKLKYFIINKTNDFERGLYEKMTPCDDRLCFSSEGGSGVGMFLTRIFDSGEKGTRWHRLTLRTEDCARSDLRITVYAADTEEFTKNGQTFSITGILADESLTLRKKLELFEPFAAKKIADAADVLLHDVTGRYIWFLTELYSRNDRPASLCELRVYLPAQSWIDLLPQIYRSHDKDGQFLERYLAIFQTVYEELDALIGSSAYYFDPECTEYDFLLWITEWLDISEGWLWEEEKLRRFILRAISLYRRRGTKEGLSEIIELFTGEAPFIIEEFDIGSYAGTELYDKTLLPMYGNDPYTITVLIKSGIVKGEHDYNALRKVAEEMLPAPFSLRIVVLEPYIFAGRFSYLGINSTLGSFKPAAFDGLSVMMRSTLSGDMPHESE